MSARVHSFAVELFIDDEFFGSELDLKEAIEAAFQTEALNGYNLTLLAVEADD